MNITSNLPSPTFEFHVAKKIREKYELDETFFSLTGYVVFANFYQVRLFVQKVNAKRDVSQHISPGEVNGAGLLHEIYHLAIKNYIRKIFPNAFSTAISNLEITFGEKKIEKLLTDFINVFPPKQVYKNELTVEEYLSGSTDSISNREILLEELILVHLANRNPAFYKIKEFFNEEYFQDKSAYRNTILTLKEFFKKEELKIGISNSDLFDFLSQPFINHSHSIWDQLEFIKNEWGIFIDSELLLKIKGSRDLFVESLKFNLNFDGGAGGTPTVVPKYKGELIDADHLVIGKSGFKYAEASSKDYEEPEQFTPDVNWMPNLILIAKNIYVWLDQLSKKYKREIKTLDQIPIEELELLKKRNINGLWLIGVWERSHASKKIKHWMGNIDAVASAYSLYDYQIAAELGGEYSYNIFNERAKQNGIRLASDMVPNHTGIYSKWVLDHPDYFIQLDYPPFPNYSFTGGNLSDDPNIEIRIEDQYWQMKDAAVVFERKDNTSGDTKYIYHGNDGTNMPWNDTAQLNLLKEEVREALIQKIFEVARKFSVIRFDAAMTLAKKHFSRLWFPEPGMGGDIPSRADHALTRQQFDDLFPKEFWREVVDRINEQMPETLLLAEAFWLMEGYFVRTLGMHRVYNSAFMNMMKNEENGKYRELITNTLEFEPEILKRYVNFMSNPDEETAIAQFGSDDKYFGVLVLMSTLPGLPMFAHGQVEGYTEKYGMEYQRAYYDEKPNLSLVEKHEKEIFPILKKRFIFSEVRNFWIYDFLDQSGNVNHNVFVYSNEAFGEKGLVVFNNKFESTFGSFFFSRQKLNGNSSNTNYLHNSNIAENLNIKNSDFHFYIMRDVTSGLEYFYNGKELHSNGFFLKLNGYEYRVYLVFQEIYDSTGNAYKLYREHYGRGIFNINHELEKIRLANIHAAYEKLFSKITFHQIFNLVETKKLNTKDLNTLEEYLKINIKNFVTAISEKFPLNNNIDKFSQNYLDSLIFLIETANSIIVNIDKDKTKSKKELQQLFTENLNSKWAVLIIYHSITKLKLLFNKNSELFGNYISSLMFTEPIKTVLKNNIADDSFLHVQILQIDMLLQLEEMFEKIELVNEEFLNLRSGKTIYSHIYSSQKKFLTEILNKDLFNVLIEVNEYKGKKYFSKERLEEILNLININLLLRYKEIVVKEYKTKKKQNDTLIKFLKKAVLLNAYIRKQAFDANFVYDEFLKKLEIA